MSNRTGKFEFVLNAEIRQIEPYREGGSLRISETLELYADDFMQLCQILAEFHKLAEHLKRNPRP